MGANEKCRKVGMEDYDMLLPPLHTCANSLPLSKHSDIVMIFQVERVVDIEYSLPPPPPLSTLSTLSNSPDILILFSIFIGELADFLDSPEVCSYFVLLVGLAHGVLQTSPCLVIVPVPPEGCRPAARQPLAGGSVHLRKIVCLGKASRLQRLISLPNFPLLFF